jgi:hypothetical protein
MLIVHIYGVPVPNHYPTKTVREPAELASDASAVLVLSLFPNLLGRDTTLADGKNQFNRVDINNREERWVRHQQIT